MTRSKSKKDCLEIKVVGENKNKGIELRARVKSCIKFGIIRKSYCERNGIDQSAVRFVFDGRPITDYNKTLKDIGVHNRAVIEVVTTQDGG